LTENDRIIESAVSEACISLFEDYALPLRKAETAALEVGPELLYAGVVGFSGDQMRGSLLLATSNEPLGRTTPTSDASLREWIAELTNQLLGRIKNKLIPRGVTLHLSTPIVLRGQRIAPMPRGQDAPFVFTCEGGAVCVWFDAEIVPGIDLSKIVDSTGLISEGESMLF
jgi:hypothetical protein